MNQQTEYHVIDYIIALISCLLWPHYSNSTSTVTPVPAQQGIGSNDTTGQKPLMVSAPETIKLHDVYQAYGGPEEGGWWYEVGQAIGTHCIFSKKQCINRLLDLTQDLELYDQPSIDDSRGLSAIHATLGTGYANNYPTERPYYC